MFEPIRKQRAAEQVAESIRDTIVDGRLGAGDALPSERDLAGRFGVNRSTIREAMLRLEAWGLVEIRQGGVTRVRDFLVSAGLQLLPFLIAPGGRMDWGMLRDLLSIRVMLLSWTAAEATRGGPEASVVERLEEILLALEQPGLPAHRAQELDYDFFEALVAATGNRVLLLISNAVREVYMRNREHFIAIYAPGVLNTSRHRRAFEALAAGQAELAADAMREHAEAALRAVQALGGANTGGKS